MTTGPNPCDDGTCNCDGPEAAECRQEAPGGPLEPFQPTEERKCPKCLYMGIKTEFHPFAVTGRDPSTACENIVGWTYPRPYIGEHLCRRCTQCGYTWAEKTADG